MSNVIVPGTVAAEPGTMTRAMLDAIESLLDPATFAASQVGLARIANAIAVGWLGNVVASLDDATYIQVSGGEVVGGSGGSGGGGAPANAEYLVAAASSGLSAERVGTDSLSASWDYTTPGQASVIVDDVRFATAGLRSSVLGYDIDGNLTDVTYSDGSTTVLTYDLDGNLTNVLYTNASLDTVATELVYDIDGNLTDVNKT